MIQFKQITLRKIDMELIEPFETSSARITHRPVLLLECEDVLGHVVWSECVAKSIPNYSPETIETAWHMLTDHILPFVLARSFDLPSDIVPQLNAHIRGNFMAKAAIDMAAWALYSVHQNQPLSIAIGGQKNRILCGVSLGIQSSPELLVQNVKLMLQQGYHKVKLKIKPGADITYIRAVREAVGPDAMIMVDANNAYTLDDIPLFKDMDQFGLSMIEQPLAWDDIYDHSILQREIQTPICLDESILHVQHAMAATQLKSARIINIKPGRVGGLSSAIQIHDFCEQNQIPVWCGGMLETGIGRAYNVALASLTNFSIPGDISPSARYWAQDVVDPEWTMDEAGTMVVPRSTAGIGVSINQDRIDNITVQKEVVSLPDQSIYVK